MPTQESHSQADEHAQPYSSARIRHAPSPSMIMTMTDPRRLVDLVGECFQPERGLGTPELGPTREGRIHWG